jgi:GNAT superfamily N-acetyltransferase
MENNENRQIEIRHFELIHEDLVDLFKALNAEMNESSTFRVKYSEDCYHDLKDTSDSFIAYHEGKPVGCAILVNKCKEVGVITNIYVAPEFRRFGICFMLFDAVEAQAKTRGHLLLISDTWNELVPMQKAFLKGGFTRYHVVPVNDWEVGYYKAGHNYWKLLV